jgi:signal transduction histidine kinase/CheY-like chemotaxis protein
MTPDALDRLRNRLEAVLPAAYRLGAMPWVFVVGVLLVVFFLVLSVFEYRIHGDHASVLFAVSLALLMVGVQRGLSFEHALHWGMAAALAAQWVAAISSGGTYSARLAWLMLIPLTPFFFYGLRSGLFWLAAVLLSWLAIGVATELAWIDTSRVGGVAHLDTSWGSYALLAAFSFVIPVAYHRMNERALAEQQERRAELERQRAELDRTQAIRDQFIASVSHELRTPMNAILGLNEWLISQVQPQSPAMGVLHHTRQSADHLMTVINDVLDYSRLQSGTLPLHPEVFNLHTCVRSAFDMLALKAQDQGLSYRCDIGPDVPVWVELDRHRLVQVLVNLLGNAIKFTPQGEVVLQLSAEGQRVRMEVRDTGIGIAEHHQALLFRRFSQADGSIQQRYGGNGLGLAISRRLMELMGAELDFRSTLGQGSSFFFVLDLPAQPAPPEVPDTAAAPLRTAQRAWCFLVVDDHPVNRLLVQRVLASNWPQAQVLEATDGLEALATVQATPVDAVLMDMRMPVMDGIDATQAIRRLAGPEARSIIVGLTANVNQDDLVRFQAAGLDGLMLKPFDWRRLCAELEALLLQRERDAT